MQLYITTEISLLFLFTCEKDAISDVKFENNYQASMHQHQKNRLQVFIIYFADKHYLNKTRFVACRSVDK